MSDERLIQSILQVAAEQANMPLLWRMDAQISGSAQAALLRTELQRLHELVFRLNSWGSLVADMEREMEEMRTMMDRQERIMAKGQYELGEARQALVLYGGHRNQCTGLPCSCGFEREFNRARKGILQHGISV